MNRGGGGVFPIEEGRNENDAHAEALQTGEEWLASSAGKDFMASDEPGTAE
jgi:hypothetical protein